MCSLTSQCLVKLGIVAWYEVNKDYVAKNLCVNRNHPELKCCGKCYLNKQLNKAENGAGKPSSTKTEKTELLLFIVPEKQTIEHCLVQYTDYYNPFKNHNYHYLFTPKVFRPPSFTA